MLSKPYCLHTASDSLLQLKTPGNGTPLLCTNNPHYKQLNKIKLLSQKQMWDIWKKDVQETQAGTCDPDSLLWQLLPHCLPPLFWSTLCCLSFVENLY